jgi:uncharacterized membrane protein YdjX (TVP38/TMEM64 family)
MMRRGIANMMKKFHKFFQNWNFRNSNPMKKTKKSEPNTKPKGIVELIIAISLMVIFSILLLNYRHEVASLGSLGYIGVFLIALASAATVFIPAPGLIIAASTAVTLNPIIIGLCGGFGAAIGEFTGYAAGKGFADVQNKDIFVKYKHLIEKYGMIAIFFLSAIPNPLFDIASIAAGAVKMQPKKFFIAVLLGNIMKYMTISFMFSVFGDAILSYL